MASKREKKCYKYDSKTSEESIASIIESTAAVTMDDGVNSARVRPYDLLCKALVFVVLTWRPHPSPSRAFLMRWHFATLALQLKVGRIALIFATIAVLVDDVGKSIQLCC